MPGEGGVVDPQQLLVVAGSVIGPHLHPVGNRHRREITERTPHLQELTNGDEAEGGGRRSCRLEVPVRPDPGAVTPAGEAGADQGRSDAPPAGVGVDDHLGHRSGAVGGGHQIEVADDGVVDFGDEVPGAVVRKFAKHLIPDRRGSVGRVRSGRTDSLIRR